MLYEEAEGSLANFFDALITAEKQTDVYRSLLVEKADFDALICFRDIDSTHCGFVSGPDFERFLKENGASINEAEGRVLVGVFDWDGDRRVSFGDFVRKVGAGKEGGKAPGRVTSEVRYALTRLLQRELESIRRVSSSLMELRIELGWKRLYSIILAGLRTKVSGECLISFLRAHAIPTDSLGIKSIFKVFDRDRDGEISYGDFLETVKLIYKGTSSRSNTIIDRNTDVLDERYHRKRQSTHKQFDRSPIRARESVSPSDFRSSKEELILAFEDVFQTGFSVSPRLSRRTSPKRPTRRDFKDEEHPCKSLLFKFLDLQLSLLKELEADKATLARRIDFHPWTCFELMSPTEGKFLTVRNLESGLGRIGVKTDSNSLRRVMLTYNCSSDGKLKYSEFAEIVTAHSFHPSRSVAIALRPETVQSLSQVFQSVLTAEAQIEAARSELSKNSSFKRSAAFSVMDTEGKGSVSEEEFRAVLAGNRLCESDEEAFALFKRYDKNRDGRVTFAEFVQEVASFAVIIK